MARRQRTRGGGQESTIHKPLDRYHIAMEAAPQHCDARAAARRRYAANLLAPPPKRRARNPSSLTALLIGRYIFILND
jgi:hypothetical protein